MPTLAERAEAIADQYPVGANGRPPALQDDNKVLKLLAALRAGNYREIACRVSGISKAAFYESLKRDMQFLDAVEKAEAEAEADLIAETTKAGRSPQFWAANMTLLERKHPDRWGRRQEDSGTPRVIVQIGVKDSDVQVQIGTSYPVSPVSVSASGSPSPLNLIQGEAVSD